MNVLDVYRKRVENKGCGKRDELLKRETFMLSQKMRDNLSYNTVLINNISQDVAIINSDNLNEKLIYSLPEEDIELGSMVNWMDNMWIVTERDANTTVQTKAKMIQCNHLLRWVADDNTIQEQWCVIEDGTKYLTGELEDRHFIVTRGDMRLAMTIAKNEYTSKFNRESRFLIDDEDSDLKLAFLLTKPLKKGWTYNGKGVFKFVLQEVTVTKDDNQELGIADYYKHFPKELCVESHSGIVIDDGCPCDDNKREGWL